MGSIPSMAKMKVSGMVINTAALQAGGYGFKSRFGWEMKDRIRKRLKHIKD